MGRKGGGRLWGGHRVAVGRPWGGCEAAVGRLWGSHRAVVGRPWGSRGAAVGQGYAGATWLEETEETWVAWEEPETSSSSPKGLRPQNSSFSMQERNCRDP